MRKRFRLWRLRRKYTKLANQIATVCKEGNKILSAAGMPRPERRRLFRAIAAGQKVELPKGE